MYHLDLYAVIQEFENGTFLGEPLLFPEVSRCAAKIDTVDSTLTELATQIVKASTPLDLHRRHGFAAPRICEVSVTIEPPRSSLEWQRAIELTFAVVRWSPEEHVEIAFVPALGIEVAARGRQNVLELARDQIRFSLARRKAAKLGAELLYLQRCRSLHLREIYVDVTLPSLKRWVIEQSRDEGDTRSVLDEVATSLVKRPISQRAFEIDGLIRSIAESLTATPARSVLLSGKPGVGKTAAVIELVRRRHQFGLSHTEFFETSGSRLVAGQTGYGMWQERCVALCRQLSKLRAIVCVGNLIELMEVGKSEGNEQGIAAFLKPYILRGDLLVVAECTPDQLPLIERQDPQLHGAFQLVEVEEPTPDGMRRILEESAADWSRPNSISFAAGALARIELLHQRYATYSANPGRPLRFLRNLLHQAAAESTIAPRVVTESFSRETGLPLFMLEDSISLELVATHGWFAERVLGQELAVGTIVEVLARVKARLTRPRKPIASFLFIGPTGVGKTEMAKTLATFLFGSADRMVRIDMSEYADAGAATRLAGGSFGSEGLLTSRVREQPFAVVLLDEFEKADAAIFDLLLQVLGEGRLTDAAGRVADFTNTIVIMTSNLGAETFEQGRVGFPTTDDGRDLAVDHFTEAVREHLRPEMFNRIDSIVPFLPLDLTTVRSIAARELAAVRRRDGLHQRDVDFKLADDVVEHLARIGFDPLYGARPLKRTIEQQLAAPLSRHLNRYSEEMPLEIDVASKDGRIEVDVRTAGAEKSALEERVQEVAATAVELCLKIRRSLQFIQEQPAVLDVANEVFRLRRRLESAPRHELNYSQRQLWPRYERLRTVDDARRSMLAGISLLENQVVLATLEKRIDDVEPYVEKITEFERAWQKWIVDFYALDCDAPDQVTLAIFGEDAGALFRLARGYFEAAPGGSTVKVAEFFVDPAYRSPTRNILFEGKTFVVKRDVYEAVTDVLQENADDAVENAAAILRGPLSIGEKEAREMVLALQLQRVISPPRLLEAKTVRDPEAFLRSPVPGPVGLGLAVAGPRVALLFGNELGVHLQVDGKRKAKCLVDVSEKSLQEYVAPEGVERRGAIDHTRERRVYFLDRNLAEDLEAKKRVPWTGSALAAPIRKLAEHLLTTNALAKLGLEP